MQGPEPLQTIDKDICDEDILLLSLAVLGVTVLASPQATPSTKVNPTACGRISSSGLSTFGASFAYECLRSVPNRVQPAQQLIQSLKAFVEWQSTLAWLKDPPKSYGFPTVDVQGSLDKILDTATQGGYESEYDFQVAIVQTINAAHDGHFFYTPDVFTAFTFENRLAQDIVSVSTDGISLPKLYRLSDLESGSAVPIAEINGQNATSFMIDLGAQFGSFQDIDAQWNSLFPTYASPNAQSPWGRSEIYLGPRLTLTYEDGKSEFGDTTATLNQGAESFVGIITGDDYYDRFCTPKQPSGSENKASKAPSKRKRNVSPRARATSPDLTLIANTPENTTAGYFLDADGYEDVAVLAITSFEEDDEQYLTSFQNAVQEFLARCQSAKKQRLVIDLTANGGGFIAAGFELFGQLFPGANKFTANNMRLSDSLVDISEIFASSSATDQKNALESFPVFFDNISPAGVGSPQGVKFETVDDIMAPVTLHNDRFTQYIGEPNNVLDTTGSLSNGSQAEASPPPFKSENIVLLTDGACSSTCTTFSYLMLFQERVKTVSVGGRPQNAQMQSLGGVEGGQSLGMDAISTAAFVALSLAKNQSLSQAQPTKPQGGGSLSLLSSAYALRRAADPSAAGGINLKNNFAPWDAGTPLQFLREPADCRFFYTRAMLLPASGPGPAWARAVDAAWTDPQRFCVRGSRTAAADSGARPVDPAFAKDGQAQTGGGGDEDGKDGDEDSAGGALERSSVRMVTLLAAVSAVMLCL
ncbi:uncharacterized protein F4812DRAFT_467403 [Daldinia caldariorum]|uniref:uncharacterized protein n=1 Tax=Daldinia caldariorum TaxID=326644 RepID=UPI00200794E4|nr:uncharacterized protein F4812DRAFT_467403 [Daldinia caldariorum]KAI1471239.1 hypothetical protein F4812DRAFT_467403 [Daldinia caldariorum]